MSKGTFQNYQHYLPATYIRRFKITSEDPKAGKDTVYGFVKQMLPKYKLKKELLFLMSQRSVVKNKGILLKLMGLEITLLRTALKY